MAFGADSDGKTRTYRVYSRQTQNGPYSLGIYTVKATADDIGDRFTEHLNSRDDGRSWVHWFLLVAVDADGTGAFPFRVVEQDGRWVAFAN